MRIVDDDVETLLTLDMSLEEDKRRRFRIQQRTAKLRQRETSIITEAELHWFPIQNSNKLR